MLISLENTYTLLTEDVDNINTLIVNNLGRVDASKDHPSISNKFKPRPLGILIEDSYNNPFFPIRPMPRVDSAKIDLIWYIKDLENYILNLILLCYRGILLLNSLMIDIMYSILDP